MKAPRGSFEGPQSRGTLVTDAPQVIAGWLVCLHTCATICVYSGNPFPFAIDCRRSGPYVCVLRIQMGIPGIQYHGTQPGSEILNGQASYQNIRSIRPIGLAVLMIALCLVMGSQSLAWALPSSYNKEMDSDSGSVNTRGQDNPRSQNIDGTKEAQKEAQPQPSARQRSAAEMDAYGELWLRNCILRVYVVSKWFHRRDNRDFIALLKQHQWQERHGVPLRLPSHQWIDEYDPNLLGYRQLWNMATMQAYATPGCKFNTHGDIKKGAAVQFVSSRSPKLRKLLSIPKNYARVLKNSANGIFYSSLKDYATTFGCRQNSVHPEVYILSNKSVCEEVLSPTGALSEKRAMWFIKSKDKHMGQGVGVGTSDDIRAILTARDSKPKTDAEAETSSCPQPKVLSKYIQPVHTLLGRKWHLRQGLYVASVDPLVAFLATTATLLSAFPYDPKNLSFIPIHVTNEHVRVQYESDYFKMPLDWRVSVREELEQSGMTREQVNSTLARIIKHHKETVLQYLHSAVYKIRTTGDLLSRLKRQEGRSGEPQLLIFWGLDMNLNANDFTWQIYDNCANCGSVSSLGREVSVNQYATALEGYFASMEIYSRRAQNRTLENLQTVKHFQSLRLLVNEDDNRLLCGGKDCQGYSQYGECSENHEL